MVVMSTLDRPVTDPAVDESFPRLMARTARFTLGVPRGLTLSPDGRRVLYIRSRSGTSRTGLLWSMDLATGDETLVVDPTELLGMESSEQLSAEERARRERMREGGAGITAYSTDREARTVAFALSSRLYVAELDPSETGGPQVRELVAKGAVIDPRMSPDGRYVAYAADRGWHVISVDGTDSTDVTPAEDEPDVSWGLAEFAASEELERYRGHWWLPDSSAALVARVDEAPVQTWWVADAAQPSVQPHKHRYPSAGTANADVTLWTVDLTGQRRELRWDRSSFPYLVDVRVDDARPALVLVMDRRQSRQQVLVVDPHAEGGLRSIREISDESWVDVVPGSPAWWGDGLATVEVSDDTYRLCVDGQPVSPVGLQVRAVIDVLEDSVLVAGHVDPVERRLFVISKDGSVQGLGPADAHVTGARSGGTTLLRVESSETAGVTFTATPESGESRQIRSLAEDPGFMPNLQLVTGPYGDNRTMVILPRGWSPSAGRLPVIMSPYGGPHHAAVVHACRAFLGEQWIADQGFAVVVADGRGTPGSPMWERAMRLDLAGPALEGQVRGLEAAARAVPDALDLDRVGIRGWSFGGYLAALAVLERPDVFHAAVAGAPPTDWTLYDTAYTERYLGLPDEQPEAYANSSLLPLAAKLERPLLIIHGMADDNVVVANTLQLSRALLEAGRAHQVLPLSGVTHMTPQEVVTENILRLELEFLREALGGG